MKTLFCKETSGNEFSAPARSRWGVISLALALAATLAIAPAARADSYNFSFSGGGINGSGVITVSNATIPGVPGGYQVTGINGFFSDTNSSANFSGAITGLEPAPLPSSSAPFPAPAFTAAGFSYDNLFYPDGDSPIVCPPEPDGSQYPFHGGALDIYGLSFDVTGGYHVDLWSNGIYAPGLSPDYEVSDALGSTRLEPDDRGAAVPVNLTTSPVPEPGSLFLLGTGMIGLVGGLRCKIKTATGISV